MSELAGKFEVRVSWKPFLLRPNTPPEGMPKPPADLSNPGLQRLIQKGKEVGIDLTFKATVSPYTPKAHALLELAKAKGKEPLQNDVQERLFDVYLNKGLTLDEALLLDIAKQYGLDQNEAKAYMNNAKVIEDIVATAASWKVKGSPGIPVYYLNGHEMLAGDQDAETFKRTIQAAAEKFPLSAAKGN